MYILGIDQGIANLGLTILKIENNEFEFILDSYITTPKTWSLGKRLNFIKERIEEITKDYEIEAVFCERINGNLARNIAYITGVLYQLFPEVELKQYVPSSVKKQATGSGKADKVEMKLKATELNNKAYNNEHIADSFLIAYCGFLEITKKGGENNGNDTKKQ